MPAAAGEWAAVLAEKVLKGKKHMHHSRSQQPSHTPANTGSPANTVSISLFAGMAAAAGGRSLELAWEGGTVATLRSRLAAELPAIAPLLARSAVAIGATYVADTMPVAAGADIAIIPPVSGG